MKNILVCGGAGFIGHHLARKLKNQGYYVIVADHKPRNEYCKDISFCNEYYPFDLSIDSSWRIFHEDKLDIDCIFQLAADMGGAGYVFTGNNDYNIMSNSAKINLHCARWAIKWKAKVFYSSSACMYPAYNQADPNNPKCSEDSAYPADPDSEYGWEKLFSERLYLAAARNCNLDVRIARFHNIYGPEGVYDGGREKAPAALCRKIYRENKEIEIWGDGEQTRSFLYIDDCVEGIITLMKSSYNQPVNIGSEEMVTINDLAKEIMNISGKSLNIRHIPGPQGVRGRNSDNNLITTKTGWVPKVSLREGLEKTYSWISEEIERINKAQTP